MTDKLSWILQTALSDSECPRYLAQGLPRLVYATRRAKRNECRTGIR
jgi:hypothetical protein